MTDRFLLTGVLVLTLVSYFTHDAFNGLPDVTPATATDEFSAERAIQLTQHILGDESPHPVGSRENQRVKKRIIAWLDEHGINHEVQQAWGCALNRVHCALAENIIATIRGERPGPHVAIMAHYDSVPPSPGAGDNAVAVATAMEIGRLLKSEDKIANPLTLLLVDAEEPGLLGAEAFFAKHPLRDQIGALINLEGSAKAGRTLLIRTSAENRGVLRVFGGAPHPYGSSHFREILERMPVGTDFSVPQRYGVTGLDMAKIGHDGLAHTRFDNTAHLHAPSIQFMGDNVYHVARELVRADLNDLSSGRDAYLNVFGQWIQWPIMANLALLAVSFIALAGTTWRIRPDFRDLMRASSLPLGIFFLIVLGFAVSYLAIHFINGDTPFYPAYKAPYRLVLFATPALIGLLIAMRSNRKRSVELGLLGVWWFWWLVSLVFAVTLEDVTPIFVLPTVVAAVLLAMSIHASGGFMRVLQLLTLVVVVAVQLGMVFDIEETQGYWFIALTAVCFSMYVSAVLPLARGMLLRTATVTAAGVWVIGFGLAVYLPIYTPESPQIMIYRMVQDHDRQKAWMEFVSLHSLPETIAAIHDFGETAIRYPWTDDIDDDLMGTSPRDVNPPQVEVLDDSTTQHGRDLTIRLRSQREAMQIGLVFPRDAGLTAFTIDNERFLFEPRQYGNWEGNYVLELAGLYDRSATVTFHFPDDGSATVWVYDTTRGLPAGFDELLEARSPLGTEVHNGDRFLVHRRLTL